MKSTYLKLNVFFLFFFLFLANLLWGQEKKNSINLSGSIAHYVKIENFDLTPFEGYYKFPLSPGAEIVYSRQILSKVELCTGINFQRVYVSAFADVPSYLDYIRRFRYNEVSVPLLLKKPFPLKNQNHWYLSMGIYNGIQMNIVSETPQRVGWIEWGDLKTIGGYSSDHFFTDIYFDAGYSKLISTCEEIAVTPFFSYRVNSTWLNTYQKKPHWGIKLSYSFKL